MDRIQQPPPTPPTNQPQEAPGGGPETTLRVYDEVKGKGGSFREEGDEKAAVILIRCLAGQGRLEEALAMIDGFNGRCVCEGRDLFVGGAEWCDI